MYYVNTFIVYSILGYLLETITAFILKYNFNSGILFGPWTPIYGIGVIIIIIVSNYLFKNLHLNRIIETIITFVLITIILTFIEWLGGITIEKMFGITFWDYSNHKYHIGKYVSLKMSLFWGIGAIIMIYIIRPILDRFIKKIPLILTILIGIIFMTDVFFTVINNT